MSGTSSRISSSTSALGIRSYTYPDRGSSSSESPPRRGALRSGSRRRGPPPLAGVRAPPRAVAAVKDLLEHADLADRLEALGDHDVERLVQHDLLAGPESVEIDRRAHAHPAL